MYLSSFVYLENKISGTKHFLIIWTVLVFTYNEERVHVYLISRGKKNVLSNQKKPRRALNKQYMKNQNLALKNYKF